jgi:hypothetical protein
MDAQATTAERPRRPAAAPAMDLSNSQIALQSMILEMGGSPALLVALSQAFGIKISPADQRYLMAPIYIERAQGWGDDFRADKLPWLGPQIRAERGEIVLGARRDLVGPSELVPILGPLAMAAPLETHLAELHLWAHTHAVARHQRRDRAQLWASLFPDHRLVTDEEVIDGRPPGSRIHHTYVEIAIDLRRRLSATRPAVS